MKRIIYCIGAAAMLLAVSCAKEHTPVAEPSDNLVQKTFTATTDMATKTSLHTDGKSVNWSTGDKISVFAINEGAVASHTAFAAENISGTTADFTGATDADATDFVALYPYNSAASVTVADGVTKVKTTIPYIQKAVKGGFDPALNLMLATTTKDANHFSFKNLCSLIKVTIPEDLNNVTAISFRTRLPMTGTFTYNVTNGTVVASTDNFGKTLTMASEDGSALEPGGTYYIVAGPNPSTDAKQQIQSLSVTLSDGTVKTIIAQKDFTLESNTIYNLGTVSLANAKAFTVKNAPNHDFPMKAGQTYKLDWTDIPDGMKLSIKSRSNKVATVSDDGTVTFTGVHGVEFIHVGYLDPKDNNKVVVEVPVAFNVVPGYYRDSPQDWSTDTNGSEMTIEKEFATLTFVKQNNNNKGRADIKRGKTYINPEYPILCFRLDDMKDKGFTGESIKLDVNYGFPMGHPNEGTSQTGRIWWGTTNYPGWNYKGQFDDGSRLIVFDSSVFSWPNVASGSGYSRVLPKDEVVCFTNFKIVYADLAPWPTDETVTVPSYRFYGFNTFKTLEEAEAFYGIEITKR